jgi:hypothetical protein
MWEGWKKYEDPNGGKSYELLVETDVEGSKIVVSLLTTLTKIKSEPLIWGVDLVAFNPGAGEYIIYEDVFSTLAEAEEKAWEKAWDTARIYREPIKFSSSTGKAVPAPSRNKSKSHPASKWKDWHKLTDTDRIKRYTLRVEAKDKSVTLSAGLYSPNTGMAVSPWSIIITTYNFYEGKYINYEGVFFNYREAEAIAWEEAQKAAKALKQTAA